MILDFWHEETIDESETLTFELPFDDPKVYLLAVDHEVQWVNRHFYIAEIEDNRDGDEVRKTVLCNALWYRLNDPTYVGSLNLSGETTEDGLATILAGTDWTVDPDTTASPTTFSLELQDKTVLYLVREWAKVTGTIVEWDTDAKTVALVDTRGEDRGVSFRYRRNLTRIRRRTRPPECTVLYPYGAQGLNIAGVNAGDEFLEDFSFYTDQGMDIADARARFTRSRVWSDPSFLRDVDLLAAAQARMDRIAQGLVSYEMDVVTLSDITGISEPIFIGDTVRVADELLNANITTTVVRRRQYPLQPWRDEIELGQLPDIFSSSTPTSRETQSEEWVMFVGDNLSDYLIRNDGDYILNRIPLEFREGGQAHWHLDFFVEGVGDGVLVVKVEDAQDGNATVYRELRLPYANGEITHGSMQWAETERSGQYDYRVRFTTEATGGADPANGVNVLEAESRFFVLAIGAVQQTPDPGDTSVLFSFTGSTQSWVVPADVTEIRIECAGAQGGFESDPADAAGGAKVFATFPVVPGETLDIDVGGSTINNVGGWPNGGDGDLVPGSNGMGGGGSSSVRRDATTFADSMIVAGAGGGQGDRFPGWLQKGGGGGFFTGEDGVSGATDGGLWPGGGAQPAAGGAAGGGTAPGTAGTFNQGGDAGNATLGTSFPGGGGGGGWYGGGGAGFDGGSGAGKGGGGGGGNGHVDGTGFDLTFETGTNLDDGYVLITWTTP